VGRVIRPINAHMRRTRGRGELRRVRVPRARARQDRSSGPWAKDRGGTPPTPLPDEAVVPVSVFNDHVGLNTKGFEWCGAPKGAKRASWQQTSERRREAAGINEVTRVASHFHKYGGNSSCVDPAVGEVRDAYKGERSGRRERRARVLLIGPVRARKQGALKLEARQAPGADVEMYPQAPRPQGSGAMWHRKLGVDWRTTAYRVWRPSEPPSGLQLAT
jgi:hypothetical protein